MPIPEDQTILNPKPDPPDPPQSSPYSATNPKPDFHAPGDMTDLPSPKGMADPAYRNKRRRIHRPFNFELDTTRRLRLKAVAAARGISMGATLRQLISAAYAMDVTGSPLCVSGRACFMPHMHPPVPSTQPPEATTP